MAERTLDMRLTMRDDGSVVVSSATTKMKNDLNSVEATSKAVTSAMSAQWKSFITLIGTIGVASAFKAIVTDAIKVTEAIGNLSIKTGASITNLDKLRQVAEKSNVSFESLSSALSILQRKLAEADKDGASPAAAALSALGLSMAEIKNLKVDEQFIVIGEAINKISDDSQKTAMAFELLGRGGTDLTLMLENLSKNFSMTNTNISPEKVAAAKAYNDAIIELKETFRQLAMDNLPYLNKALKFIHENFALITGVIVTLIGIKVATWLYGITLAIIAQTAALYALASGWKKASAARGVYEGMHGTFSSKGPQIPGTYSLLPGILQKIKDAAIAAAGALATFGAALWALALAHPVTAIIAVLAALAVAVTTYLNWDWVVEQFDKLLDKVKTVWETIGEYFQKIKNWFDPPYKIEWDVSIRDPKDQRQGDNPKWSFNQMRGFRTGEMEMGSDRQKEMTNLQGGRDKELKQIADIEKMNTEMDKAIMASTGNRYKDSITKIEQERDAFIRAGGDETKAAEDFNNKLREINKQRYTAAASLQAEIFKMVGDNYNAEMVMIGSKIQALRDAGMDEIAIAKWVELEKGKIKADEINRIAVAQSDFNETYKGGGLSEARYIKNKSFQQNEAFKNLDQDMINEKSIDQLKSYETEYKKIIADISNNRQLALESDMDTIDAWKKKEYEAIDALGVENEQVLALKDSIDRLAEAKGLAAEKANASDLTKWADSALSSMEQLEQTAISAAESLSSGFADAFMEFANETKSAKEAFLDFAKSFLDEITKMIIQQMILNALKSSAGGASGWGALIGLGTSAAGAASGGGAVTTAALGGIFPGGFQAFAQGGIATRPTLGLVGEGGLNEAVIPLPDGKNVPVKMRGGGNTINNNINVSVDGSKGGSREQNDRLGKAIAKAVDEQIRKNIMNERRWGGVLGPQAERTY